MERDYVFFEKLHFKLLGHFKALLSVSYINNVTFNELFIFYFNTIRLFSDIMKGIGHNRKDEGKEKGDFKVHMFIDVH